MGESELDKSIRISDLLVTQSSLRVWERVTKMVDFVRDGGTFTPDRVAEFHSGESNRTGLVVLSRFPNGQVYVHDGHHRSVSAHLGGREYFCREERLIVDWDSIERYEEINPERGWVTPLNLQTEVRLPDVLQFKQEALAMSGDVQREFILANRHRFVTRRKIRTIAEMCAQVASVLSITALAA